jgi:GxxExxY protein
VEHQELTKKIIGCAYRIYNQLGSGFLESVYEKCMLIELKKLGLNTLSQQPVAVYYEGEIVGNFFTDLIVENIVIVELKSVQSIVKAHEVQLVNYLTATGINIGLIINFAESEVEVKRKVRNLKNLN